MREILFRGKSAEDGKWFTGQLLHFKSPVSEKELNVVVEGCEWDDSNELFNIGRRAKVVPETVGQYTGLTDKNGKKIFEGDILLKGFEKVLVKWNENQCRWSIYSDGYEICGFNESTQEYFEVIGNIHDNPELLEVEVKE